MSTASAIDRVRNATHELVSAVKHLHAAVELLAVEETEFRLMVSHDLEMRAHEMKLIAPQVEQARVQVRRLTEAVVRAHEAREKALFAYQNPEVVAAVESEVPEVVTPLVEPAPEAVVPPEEPAVVEDEPEVVPALVPLEEPALVVAEHRARRNRR